MADHVLQAGIDFLVSQWGAMGKEAGSRRDYRGVKRIAYDLPLEEDAEIPWVQVDLGASTPFRDESSTHIYLTQEVFCQVHLMADAKGDDDFDIVRPILEALADIHDAAFADRSLNGSVHYIDLAGHEVRPFGVEHMIGATLRVTYNIHYWFIATDMSSVG